MDIEFVIHDPDMTDRRGVDRGYHVARIDAFVDSASFPEMEEPPNPPASVPEGKVHIGFIKFTWIPKKEWQRIVPTVWHYSYLFRGYHKFEGYVKDGKQESLYKAILYDLIWDPTIGPDKAITKAKKKLMPDMLKFKSQIVDKPFVDYIRVSPEVQRQGVGTQLYIQAAKYLATKGLKLHASTLQSDAAKASWEAMKRKGLPVKKYKKRVTLDYRKLAALYLTKRASQFQAEMGKLERLTQPLQTNPGNAGAVFDSLDHITKLLNMLEAANTDPKLETAIDSTRGYWRKQSEKLRSNDGMAEVGQALTTAHMGLETLIKRIQTAATPEIRIDGVQIHNTANAPEEHFRPFISKALSLLGPFRSCPIHIVRKDQVPMTVGHPGAYYKASEDNIYFVWPVPDERDAVERLLHEIGHRVWFKNLNSEQRSDWEEAFGSYAFETPYARISPKEEFAEVFAHWRLKKAIRENALRMEIATR
jgi:GNAT superfamily N-acetyltransferase